MIFHFSALPDQKPFLEGCELWLWFGDKQRLSLKLVPAHSQTPELTQACCLSFSLLYSPKPASALSHQQAGLFTAPGQPSAESESGAISPPPRCILSTSGSSSPACIKLQPHFSVPRRLVALARCNPEPFLPCHLVLSPWPGLCTCRAGILQELLSPPCVFPGAGTRKGPVDAGRLTGVTGLHL